MPITQSVAGTYYADGVPFRSLVAAVAYVERMGHYPTFGLLPETTEHSRRLRALGY